MKGEREERQREEYRGNLTRPLCRGTVAIFFTSFIVKDIEERKDLCEGEGYEVGHVSVCVRMHMDDMAVATVM